MKHRILKTVIVVVAIAILLLGAYVAAYVLTIKAIDTTTATYGTPFKWRLIEHKWQYTFFAPAIWAESKLIGIPVQAELPDDLKYLRYQD